MKAPRLTLVTAWALVMTGSGFVTGPVAGADSSPPVVVSIDARPEPVGLYASRESRVVVDVVATDDVAVTRVDIFIAPTFSGAGDDTGNMDATLVRGTPQSGTWRAVFGTPSVSVADRVSGRWLAGVGIEDAAGNSDGTSPEEWDYFYVKYNTMIRSFNVAEPVTSGSFIRMYGQLVRLDESGVYVGYSDKPIQVLFRPAGSTTWRDRGTIRTNSLGYFANFHSFKAYRDGVWKVRFGGTVNALPETSHGDLVDAR